MLFSKNVKPPPITALTVTLVLFAGWTGVTTLFALYPEPSYARWEGLLKTILFAFLIPMLFHRKEDLRLLVWVLVISIAYYGTKGGIWTLVSGGANRVHGPPRSYIADNNDIAVAIVMIIPLMWYLQRTSPHKSVRWGLFTMALFCAVAVLGTYSRGALLAVCAMGAFLWWKTSGKVPLLLVAVLAVPIALTSMPEKWYERMSTIGNYQQESSANARLNSWATMLNVAKDRPIVGGGFEVATSGVYARYSPNPRFRPQVAHSIYFQALGEHGFVGLALYLALLYALWTTANKIIRSTKGRADCRWAYELSLMMQVSVIGFAVGGAFLSLVSFDVPYYLVGLMAAALALVRREASTQAPGVVEQPVPYPAPRSDRG
jgi:probable O-glycosylation ligase (exosortase A-associated)